MKKSYALLIASILVTVSTWGYSFDVWYQVFEPRSIFSLLGALGAVIASWLGQSPIKQK